MCICSMLSCIFGWLNGPRMGMICFGVALVLNSISLVSPYWMVTYSGTSFLGIKSCARKDTGLLGECCTEMPCMWIWQNGFHLEYNLPEYLLITQIVYTSGFVFFLPALFVILFRCCCVSCQMSPATSRAIAVLCVLSVCLFGSALFNFWWKVTQNSLLSLIIRTVTFSWAFMFALVGTAFLLVSAIFWFMDSRRQTGSANFQDNERGHANGARHQLMRRK